MVQILKEYRFPLHLEPAVETVWDLYNRAKDERWDPSRSVAWERLEPAGLPERLRAAARLAWSHRAWLLFGRLSETPALLVRFCLERQRESDPKYFLSLRGTEEAWHLDVCHRVATAFGGFVAAPANAAYAERFNLGLHREALDAELGLDSYVAAYVALREEIEAALLQAALEHTRDVVLCSALELMLRDKRRHARFGWLYLAGRRSLLDGAARDAVVRRSVEMLERFCSSGLMVPALAPDVAGEIAAAQDAAAGAGLGAAPLDAQVAALKRALSASRARLAEIGVESADLGLPY